MMSRGLVISVCYISKLDEFLSDKRGLTEKGFGEESNNGFVYILLGQKDEKDMDVVKDIEQLIANIGQSCCVKDRLERHRSEKPWIQKIITICHPIFNDKNAREFYERMLWNVFNQTGKFKMDNEEPNGAQVDQATEKDVIFKVHPDIMPFIKYATSRGNPFNIRNGAKVAQVHIKRNSPNNEPYARGELRVEGGVTVIKDSYCFSVDKPKNAVESTKRNYKSIGAMQKKLCKDGILKVVDDNVHFKYIFAVDYCFSTFSAASSLILGKNSSGHETWIHSEGKYKGKSVGEVQKEIAKRNEKRNEKRKGYTCGTSSNNDLSPIDSKNICNKTTKQDNNVNFQKAVDITKSQNKQNKKNIEKQSCEQQNLVGFEENLFTNEN